MWVPAARQRPRRPGGVWGSSVSPPPTSLPDSSLRRPALRLGGHTSSETPARGLHCGADARLRGAAGPGTPGLRVRVRRDPAAGMPLSSRGGSPGFPGLRRPRSPGPAGTRGTTGRGGRREGDLTPPAPTSPALPARTPAPPRPRPRPAAAAAAASASQSRSGGGSEAGACGGWAGSPSGGRSAGKAARPALAHGPRGQRPEPPVPALPWGVGGVSGWARAGSPTRTSPQPPAERPEPHPGRALGSGPRGAQRGREGASPTGEDYLGGTPSAVSPGGVRQGRCGPMGGRSWHVSPGVRARVRRREG